VVRRVPVKVPPAAKAFLMAVYDAADGVIKCVDKANASR
jgi:hypothetical protein